MAGFKAHMAFGILTGAAWAAVVIGLSLITFWVAPVVFFAGFIGAFLPDLDSDPDKPLRILLLCTGAAGAVMAGLYLSDIGQTDPKVYLIYAIGAFLFVYFILGGIFKKLTHHRGIFHSIPATVLAALVTLTIMNNFNLDPQMKMAISLAVGIGYSSHLILDELNSIVNLNGIPFIPNKSSGSALKLYSNNHIVTVSVYIMVIFLGYINIELITDFYKAIF